MRSQSVGPLMIACNHMWWKNLIFIKWVFLCIPIITRFSSYFFSFFSSFSILLPIVSLHSSIVPFFLLSPLYAYLLSSFSTSLSPSPSTSSPPCGRLIPLSYSFFCPKDISPPTRARLIPFSLSIYLYQWAKVTLSSSSRWTDSACGRGQKKRWAEHKGAQSLLVHKFNCTKQWEYYINSTL